jgi:predicted nucleotidyltransferase
MKDTDLPDHIQPLIQELLSRGLEIWLFGSRVNPTNKPANDWDIVVFGNAKLLLELSELDQPENLDLFVVTDGDHFESPWPRSSDGVIKSGELRKWKWTRDSATKATYEGTHSTRRTSQKSAVLIYNV